MHAARVRLARLFRGASGVEDLGGCITPRIRGGCLVYVVHGLGRLQGRCSDKWDNSRQVADQITKLVIRLNIAIYDSITDIDLERKGLREHLEAQRHHPYLIHANVLWLNIRNLERIGLRAGNGLTVEVPLEGGQQIVHSDGVSDRFTSPHSLIAAGRDDDGLHGARDLKVPVQSKYAGRSIEAVDGNFVLGVGDGIEPHLAGEISASVVIGGDGLQGGERGAGINGQNPVKAAAYRVKGGNARGGRTPGDPHRMAAAFAVVKRFARLYCGQQVDACLGVGQGGCHLTALKVIREPGRNELLRNLRVVADRAARHVRDHHAIVAEKREQHVADDQGVVGGSREVEAVELPLIAEGPVSRCNNAQRDRGEKIHLLTLRLRGDDRQSLGDHWLADGKFRGV